MKVTYPIPSTSLLIHILWGNSSNGQALLYSLSRDLTKMAGGILTSKGGFAPQAVYVFHQ